MVIPFSRQFRFTPVVLTPPPGRETLEFTRSLKSLCLTHHDGVLVPEDQAIVDSLTLPAEAPECVDVEERLAALENEERRQLVRTKSAELAETLRGELPRLEGETDVAARVTALAKACAGLPAGTVVFDRRTDRSHVLFLMEHIQIGLRTGIHRMVGLADHTPTPKRIHRAMAMANEVIVTDEDREDSRLLQQSIKEIGIGVGSCLAWALPFPFGPIAAAGMSVVQVLCGGPGGPSLSDILTKSNKIITDYIDANSIKTDGARLAAFSSWLVGELATLEKLQSSEVADSQDCEVLLTPVINNLRAATGPEGHLYLALFDLKINYLDNDAGLSLCVLAVGLYLTALKLIMQFEVQILACTTRAGSDAAGMARVSAEWLMDYGRLVTALESDGKAGGGVVAQATAAVAAAVLKRKQERLAKISAPVRLPDYVKEGLPTGYTVAYAVAVAGAWSWKDGGDEHILPDTKEADGCKTKWKTYESEARDAYRIHRQTVSDRLDAKYSYVDVSIQKWKAALSDWSQHHPPGKPSTAPVVDPAGWTGKPPIPQRAPGWVEGSLVAYAVQYVNGSGPGQVGPFSEAVAIHAGTGATVTGLPSDPLKMAEKLYIHRRITVAQGNDIVRLAGIVDAGTMQWHDGAL